MPDYVPYNDTKLREWARRFADKLAEYRQTLGLSEAEVAALKAEQEAFATALQNHQNAQRHAMAMTAAKRDKHDDLVRAIRAMFRRIDYHPALTPAMRAEMGLNVRDGARQESIPLSDPPGIYVRVINSRVFVHFGTHPMNEQKNTKPPWATGVNVYRRKDGEEEFRLVAFEISSPYIEDVPGPACGYSYMVRYRGQKAHELGPHSNAAWVAVGGAMAA